MGRRLFSLLLSIGLLVSLTTVTAAQDDPPGPEGIDWNLATYLAEGETVSVPPEVQATLLLEDGTASGSGGCNSFSGSYELDGAAIGFDERLSMTMRTCIGPAEEVEAAYLSSLLAATSWAVEAGQLELSDDAGELLLSFRQAGAGVTAAELAALVARLDAMAVDVGALDGRLDNIRIGTLRERIRDLEADNRTLKRQVAELRASLGSGGSSSSVGTTSFNTAERVLLEGVPARIKGTCKPLRQRLPTGAAAAVQCSPNTTSVTEMAYYLMDKASAVKLYDRKMSAQGLEPLPDVAPEGVTGCWEGNPGYGYAPGGYTGGIGCYREDGRANVRVIEQATACKQLKVGTKVLKTPVMYTALTGPNRDIQQLYDWSQRQKDNLRVSGLTVPIKRPNGARSPNCWAG